MKTITGCLTTAVIAGFAGATVKNDPDYTMQDFFGIPAQLVFGIISAACVLIAVGVWRFGKK